MNRNQFTRTFYVKKNILISTIPEKVLIYGFNVVDWLEDVITD